ncbi:MAG: glycosyl transferase family 2 [Firmicutes bacterium]|uniref:Glycosyl transferase family 2 n=1 Tax=Candidatus Stercoripulliclostridium pullicola TaxID=2840953 RepID=A0A940ID29_9FIRM|nr:glycosyl transferase family 2 [Candidatus Stercoripulliclostridium pullicola]
MKIAVYAICKNESKFVDRWMDSMSEADEITVLDTGSEDDTVEKLRARGARVFEEKIAPWRFDVARNRSLELVSPDVDVCVCTDLDEVLHAGWAELLRKAWKPGATLATYRYTWSFTPDGKEGVVFWYSKVHSRYGYRWKHPVHEVLEWTGEGQEGFTVTVEGMQLDHLPDPAKSRAQYLPLLEMSVKEEPSDDRNVHYLGREYMFRRRWDDCIVTLKKHLALPTATWRDERAASMRFIARSYAMKGDKAEAENWYMRAITEAPYLREPYTDFASFLYYSDDWDGVLYFTSRALAIKERPRSYICEAAAWGSLPDDLRSIAFYKTGRIKEALEAAERALTFEPNNDRIRENAEFFRKELGKT